MPARTRDGGEERVTPQVPQCRCGLARQLVVATVDDELRRASGPAFEISVELEQPIAVGELADILSHRHGVAHDRSCPISASFFSEMVASGYICRSPGAIPVADPRPVPAAIRAAARLGLPVDVWRSKIEPDGASEVLARAVDRMTGFLAAAVLEGPVEAADEPGDLVAAWQDELAAAVLIEATPFAPRRFSTTPRCVGD